MTQPGQVRKPGPTEANEDAPIWMRTIMNNAAAYGDFILYCAQSVQRSEAQIADFLAADKMDEAKFMLAKREVVLEMRHILESYRKEGMNVGTQ